MKILVMRPSPEGEELVENLNNIGILSWHFPLFDFFPSVTRNSLSKKVYDLYISDAILVFSKKAVHYTNLYFKKNYLQWPSCPKYYAIGRNTAALLYKHIKKKIFIPKNIENSENLLKILEDHNLKKTKIILLQGERGRTLIQDSLKKKKYNISVIECYKRVFKKFDEYSEIGKWRSYQINTLVITNSEVLIQLNNIISDIDKKKWLFKCRVFVVSTRLKDIAKQLGWKNIIVTDSANNQSLLKIIYDNYN